MTEFVKIVMEFLVPMLVVILVITQIIMPMFIPNLSYFWLFKKGGHKHLTTRSDDEEQSPKSGLDEAVDEVANELSKDAEKLKQTKGKVDETIEKLKGAKKDSFNNLNNP